MNASRWIRQMHRWVAMAFTVAVIVNIVAMLRGTQAVWVGLLALLPLALLLLSGLYLFVLPYLGRTQGFAGDRKEGSFARPGDDA